MRAVLKAFLLFVLLAIVIATIGLFVFVSRGVSARAEPGAIERFMARRVRGMAIRREARALTNPTQASPEVIAEGRAHFADHCALCHGNDGSGTTEIGAGLWPKPPDMRLAATQNLSDGELFWIIQNGIRFSGMPAWGSEHGREEAEASDHDHHEEHGHDAADTWKLVRFIRQLPKLTPHDIEEMEALNPKAPDEKEEAPHHHH
jgi:mono/diheme cytochrome c family protein